MSAYARIYGFQIYAHTEIKGREEDFTWIGQNNYMLNADYELLEEILINDQCPPPKKGTAYQRYNCGPPLQCSMRMKAAEKKCTRRSLYD